MILNAILGVLDLLGGILLIISAFVPYGESGFIMTVGGVFITKGVLLLIYGKLGGGSQTNWGGVLDLIVGFMFIGLFFNIYLFVFPLIGLIMIVKGVAGFIKSIV
jgi:hypothetical protein